MQHMKVLNYQPKCQKKIAVLPAHNRGDTRLEEGALETLHTDERVAAHERFRVKGGHATLPEDTPLMYKLWAGWNPCWFIQWVGNTVHLRPGWR